WELDAVPERYASTAEALAQLYERAGEPAAAAGAWEKAAQASARAIELRATRDARLAEVRHSSTIFQNAAYRLAEGGEPGRAVELLELGRARELAAWLEKDLVDLDRLRYVDPELCARFVAARDAVDALQSRSGDGAELAAARAAQEYAASLER